MWACLTPLLVNIYQDLSVFSVPQAHEVAVSASVVVLIAIGVRCGCDSFDQALEWLLNEQNICLTVVLEEQVVIITALLYIGRSALQSGCVIALADFWQCWLMYVLHSQVW